MYLMALYGCKYSLFYALYFFINYIAHLFVFIRHFQTIGAEDPQAIVVEFIVRRSY